MTGPEHYRAAEEDMAAMNGKSPEGVQALLARAQVHATLALAAATALCQPDERGYISADLYNAWHQAGAGEATR